jgi:large subunit ribosomal protein L6
MPKLDHIAHKISFGEGVSATIDGISVTVSKGSSTLTREFLHPRVVVKQTDEGLEVFCDLPRRAEKALAGTWAAHLRNMVHGVDAGFEYKLKAVYSQGSRKQNDNHQPLR